jgi:hypothetical protein
MDSIEIGGRNPFCDPAQARTSCNTTPPHPPRVLTDKEAADIRKKPDEGWRGPVLLTWLYRLLDDREERVRREGELRATAYILTPLPSRS